MGSDATATGTVSPPTADVVIDCSFGAEGGTVEGRTQADPTEDSERVPTNHLPAHVRLPPGTRRYLFIIERPQSSFNVDIPTIVVLPMANTLLTQDQLSQFTDVWLEYNEKFFESNVQALRNWNTLKFRNLTILRRPQTSSTSMKRKAKVNHFVRQRKDIPCCTLGNFPCYCCIGVKSTLEDFNFLFVCRHHSVPQNAMGFTWDVPTVELAPFPCLFGA